MPTILIVGLAHGVQTTTGSCSALQKKEYEIFIKSVVQKYEIDLIGEEWDPTSNIETIAKAANPTVCWKAIDLTSEQKMQLRMPNYVPASPQPPATPDGDPRTQIVEGGFQTYLKPDFVSVEWRIPEDAKRDEHMFNRVVEELDRHKNVLLLCGFNHLTQLAQRFRRGGYTVKECDSLIDVLYANEHPLVKFPL